MSDPQYTRKEASDYLASIGCPVAPKTLANLAANRNAGGGPEFISTGWHTTRYAKSALDKWAKARMRRVR